MRRLSPAPREACFWASAAGSTWILLGYPLSLMLLPSRGWRQGQALPRVTVLLAAYREFELLPRKLASVRDLDYPKELIQTVVVVDGDAALAELARSEAPDAVVRLVPERRGKVNALNLGLRDATGEVILLTDAHNTLEAGSLKAAVRHFADPAIWGVTGRWSDGGSVYDRYEDLIRRLETRSGSVAGAFGQFLAVRRDRLGSYPPGLVNEDFWLVCRLVGAGGRLVYEPEATSASDTLRPANELERRSRISAGRALALGELRSLPPRFLWRLLSHKVGRLVLPFTLLGSLISSLSLVYRRPYREFAVLQGSFYAIGILGARGWSPSGPVGFLVGAARQFTLGNLAGAIGVLRGLRRRQDVVWKPVR